MDLPAADIIDSIFAASAPAELPDGSRSGIIKTRFSGHIQVSAQGLVNDLQVDHKVHGGADKALHHFPAQHYARLRQQFPGAAATLQIGTIGENISSANLSESEVFIGDTFKLGSAVLQLSLPRRPCWKIDQRYDTRGIAAWIHQQGSTGWYYRVLQPGKIRAGDSLALTERQHDSASVLQFHQLTTATRPPLDALDALRRIASLPAALSQRLAARVAWLKRHG